VVKHFDTCLGCMACETACPSGVRYAPLVEETRAAIDHHHRHPILDRVFRQVLFSVLPYPDRLRQLARPLGVVNLLRRYPSLLRLMPLMFRNLVALAPDASRAGTKDTPEMTPAAGTRRLRVGFVTGCVQRVFFAH